MNHSPSHVQPEAAREPRPSRAETLAYVALRDASMSGATDAIAVVDIDDHSPTRGTVVGLLGLPGGPHGIEHLAWHSGPAESRDRSLAPPRRDRFLIAPCARSSAIQIVDTLPDPRAPRLEKSIARELLAARTGYAAPRVAHSRPDGILVGATAASEDGGSGGILVLDPLTFEVRGRWEGDGHRAPAYDFLWHSRHRVLVASEWGPPALAHRGLDARRLLHGGYCHALHLWDLDARTPLRSIDLGRPHQLVGAIRPSHDPARGYGFAASTVSSANLSGAVFLWHLEPGAADGPTGRWRARKVIEVPAEVARGAALPPVLLGSLIVPPLVTNLSLARDDRMLYVSAWGSGALLQYDVSDPFNPVLAGSVYLGGLVRRASHPADARAPLHGGPQALALSHDGRRLFVTNAFRPAWHGQFYPGPPSGWMAQIDVDPAGGMRVDPGFLVRFEGGAMPTHVRLLGAP